jgi:hypothetical protein
LSKAIIVVCARQIAVPVPTKQILQLLKPGVGAVDQDTLSLGLRLILPDRMLAHDPEIQLVTAVFLCLIREEIKQPSSRARKVVATLVVLLVRRRCPTKQPESFLCTSATQCRRVQCYQSGHHQSHQRGHHLNHNSGSKTFQSHTLKKRFNRIR